MTYLKVVEIQVCTQANTYLGLIWGWLQKDLSSLCATAKEDL